MNSKSAVKSEPLIKLILFPLLSFGPGTHGGSSERTCGYPFDGRGRVLAHAFFPSDGRAHFDEDETFTDGTSSGTNLLWVATHEFGHSLGIDHSDVRNAVMYPYYTGYYLYGKAYCNWDIVNCEETLPVGTRLKYN